MELSENILWLLKQAFHFALRTVNEGTSEHGVTVSQVGLMRQLANEPGLSGAELSRQLLITPQGVQTALAALEHRGLVERRPDPEHGRIIQAYLTAEGRQVVTAALADALTAHDKVFGVLSSDEKKTLHDLLARVVEKGTGHTMSDDHSTDKDL